MIRPKNRPSGHHASLISSLKVDMVESSGNHTVTRASMDVHYTAADVKSLLITLNAAVAAGLVQVIDLLVRVLQFPLQGAPDLTHLTRVFKGAYDVLYTYMIGNSRKNALYFAKYIDFFQTQITVKVVCL